MTFARQAIPQPRNAKAIAAALERGTLKPGDCIVVSFVGDTDLEPPHVYADPGRRYDWRFLAGLHATIVVRKGADTAAAMKALYRLTAPYPSVVDVDRQVVASLVDGARGALKLWPFPRGGDVWRSLFA